jgi:8-oxo-dGTP diphosphatase
MPNTEPDFEPADVMEEIHVAVGIIWNLQKTAVLIAKRPDHLHQGGLWEFPGGKVEVGESVIEALGRELQEELAIKPGACAPALEVRYCYPDKTVLLDVWQVLDFVGQPTGCEGQPVAWVSLQELGNYAFPEANLAIIEYLDSACSD